MRKKVTVSVLLLLTLISASSVIAISQANVKPKPDYVIYNLKIIINPALSPPPTSTDSSNFPVVVTDGYVPDTAIVSASATINGVVYTYPSDFDYSYSYHEELNVVTGAGLEMVQETLTFNNLHGHPTLIGRTEEKVTGEIISPTTDVSHLEILGNFQLTGTKMFSDVQGSGTGMLGVDTGYVVYHFAWISGWPQ